MCWHAYILMEIHHNHTWHSTVVCDAVKVSPLLPDTYKCQLLG